MLACCCCASKLGVCMRLADAMPDRCDPDRIEHAMFEMVMARASAFACGRKDAIDLDWLRPSAAVGAGTRTARLVYPAAVALGLEDGAKLRVDTTVVETDIHHPTDMHVSRFNA
jgi:hypothetical protein